MKRKSITLTFTEIGGVAHVCAGRQKVTLCGQPKGRTGADARALQCEACMQVIRDVCAGGRQT